MSDDREVVGKGVITDERRGAERVNERREVTEHKEQTTNENERI